MSVGFPLWAGDLEKLLWFTIIAFIASHLIFWRVRSPRLHTAANYCAVLIGGLSLASTGYQSRAQLAQVSYGALSEDMHARRERIRDYLDDVRRLTCEIRYHRSEWSPPDFDDLVADQDLACKATSRLLADAGRWITNSDAPIVLPPYGRERLRTRYARREFEFVNKAIADYNLTAAARRRYDAMKATTVLEVSIAVFGPYLAALAFTIALGAILFKPRRDETDNLRSGNGLSPERLGFVPPPELPTAPETPIPSTGPPSGRD